MENLKDDILMKVRSSRACISAGYRLFTGNFKRIFRYSWLAALLLAAAGSLYSTFVVSQYPQLVISLLTAQATGQVPQESIQFLAILGGGGFVMFWLFPLFFSYGFSQLRMHKETGSIPYPARLLNVDGGMMWRTLKCYLCMALLLIIGVAIIGGVGAASFLYLSKTAALVAYSLVSIVMLLLTFPLYYVAMKYILDKSRGFWGTLTQRYKTGYRHYGYVFVIAFVDLLTACIASIVTTLPSLILSTANLQAQTGVLNGDPLGMPSYMTWLTFVVFLIAQFIRAYILLSVAFPLYYMYGSIEVQEEDRKEAINQIHRQ